MATKADSAHALRKSLIPPGADPLPPGWGLPFKSRPYGRHRSHWYVTAPYDVAKLRNTARLEQTVFANSYEELRQKVWTQHDTYEQLTAS